MLHINRKSDDDKDDIAGYLYADEVNELVDNINSYLNMFNNPQDDSYTEQLAYATATFNSDITYVGIFSDNQTKITLVNTTAYMLKKYLPRFSGTFIPNDTNSGRVFIRIGNLEYMELTDSRGNSLSKGAIQKHHLYGFSFDIALNKMVLITAGAIVDEPITVECEMPNIDYKDIKGQWLVVDGKDDPIPVAYKNGNKENIFRVNDPIDDYDAVNLHTLKDLLPEEKEEVTGCIVGETVVVSTLIELYSAIENIQDKSFYGEYKIQLKPGEYKLDEKRSLYLNNVANGCSGLVIESFDPSNRATITMWVESDEYMAVGYIFDINNSKVIFRNLNFNGLALSNYSMVVGIAGYKSSIIIYECNFDIPTSGVYYRADVIYIHCYITVDYGYYAYRRFEYEDIMYPDYDDLKTSIYPSAVTVGNFANVTFYVCTFEPVEMHSLTAIRSDGTYDHIDSKINIYSSHFLNFLFGIDTHTLNIYLYGENRFENIASTVIRVDRVPEFKSGVSSGDTIFILDLTETSRYKKIIDISSSTVFINDITVITPNRDDREISILNTVGSIGSMFISENPVKITTSIAPNMLIYSSCKKYTDLTLLGDGRTVSNMLLTDNESNADSKYLNVNLKNFKGEIRSTMYLNFKFLEGRPSFITLDDDGLDRVAANIPIETLTTSGLLHIDINVD